MSKKRTPPRPAKIKRGELVPVYVDGKPADLTALIDRSVVLHEDDEPAADARPSARSVW